MRVKWFCLFGVILGLMLLAGPLAGGALATGDNGGTPAGHDMSSMSQSDQMSGHDMNAMGSMSHNSSGHSGVAQDLNTPPNWPVIYGFGAVNLLVIIAAALLKNNKSTKEGVPV